MPKKKLTVEAINARLEAACVPLRLNASGKRGKLVLRGTFPGKPGSGKGPHQQRYSLGLYNNPAGLDQAESEAHRVAAELATGRFEWPSDRSGDEERIGYWVAKFKQQWLETQTGDADVVDLRWRENYWYPCFKHLDEGRKLKADYLRRVGERQWRTGSRAEQKGLQLLARLAEMAGVEVELKAASYNPGKVERNIPPDADIEAAIDGMKYRPWQWVAAMMATYGLRDHEIFHCTLEWRQHGDQHPLVSVVEDETKTGAREVYPIPFRWVERWQLWDVVLPKVTARINKEYGDRVSTQFKRYKLPFRPYDLRHAWNIRAALDASLPASVAAQFAGHDAATNLKVYQRHISQARAAEAWLKSTEEQKSKNNQADRRPGGVE